MESSSSKPRAVFMVFGTKGDIYSIAAIAAAFASDQEHYDVVFITHSAHKNLSAHLEAKNISWHPVSTPPVLSANQQMESVIIGSMELSFSEHKKVIQIQHRQECLSAIERVFAGCPSLEGDFVLINFFALEGWSFAELFQVRCVIAAPYVVPCSSRASFERRFKKELPVLYNYLKEAPLNKTNWSDVMHWMWPLFKEEWGSWRHDCLKLSPLPCCCMGLAKRLLNVQFSCGECRESSLVANGLCSSHSDLQHFLEQLSSCSPIFIGLSSAGSRVFFRIPDHCFWC